MQVVVIRAPQGAKFDNCYAYPVFGDGFVFDDNAEAYYLDEIEYEVLDNHQ